MNEIKITHELCAEDRARIDRLTAALELITKKGKKVVTEEKATAPEVTPEKAEAPAETTKATAPAVTPAKVETPAEATTEPEQMPIEEEPKKETEPAVTIAQIQQKVVALVTSDGGAKKAAVRDIISAYAKKVSDLPKDKWDEVWAKLTALESEA